MSSALITGITGQDSSYLAELLPSKGYRVIGMAHRTEIVMTNGASHGEFKFIPSAEVTDGGNARREILCVF